MVRGQAAMEMAQTPADYQDAVREFQEAVRRAPAWADPYYHLGIAQEKSAQFSEAAASFKKYLQLAPNAPDAAKIQEKIYKLEYKAEQVLTVSDIVDALVNFSGWVSPAGRSCRIMWRELYLSRTDSDTVRALQATKYYPERDFHQTLKVTGPVLKYVTNINVCDVAANRQSGWCDSVMENEIEVVSRRLVKVNQKVLRGGSGAGVSDGQKLSCSFQKK
jgi:tetratricopeptide (TPR) repeat protein